jgi:hypothetical protein
MSTKRKSGKPTPRYKAIKQVRLHNKEDDPARAPVRKLRISEAVETGVEGLLRFFTRYLRTVANVILQPRSAVRKLIADRRTDPPKYLLPFTFLAIGVFLLSLLGQVAGANIVDWIWFSDEIGQKVTERLRQEFSLVAVVIQAIPGMLAVFLLSGVFIWLARPWPLTVRVAMIGFAYAFGAQAFLLFSLAFGSIGLSNYLTFHLSPLEPGGVFLTLLANIMPYVLLAVGFAMLVAAFAGPMAFALRALRIRSTKGNLSRIRSFAARAWLIASIVFGHAVLLHGARTPSDIIEVARGETTPQFTLKQTSYNTLSTTDSLLLHMTIQNRSERSIVWRTEQIRLSFQPDPESTGKCPNVNWMEVKVNRVFNSNEHVAPLIEVPAGQSTWAILELDVNKPSSFKPLLTTHKNWRADLWLQANFDSFEEKCMPIGLSLLPSESSK